jgi:hypothetical protein
MGPLPDPALSWLPCIVFQGLVLTLSDFSSGGSATFCSLSGSSSPKSMFLPSSNRRFGLSRAFISSTSAGTQPAREGDSDDAKRDPVIARRFERRTEQEDGSFYRHCL